MISMRKKRSQNNFGRLFTDGDTDRVIAGGFSAVHFVHNLFSDGQ